MEVTENGQARTGQHAPQHAESRPSLAVVRYGPGPDQVVPHSWAETMLTALAAENTRTFTTLLGRASLDGGGQR